MKKRVNFFIVVLAIVLISIFGFSISEKTKEKPKLKKEMVDGLRDNSLISFK